MKRLLWSLIASLVLVAELASMPAQAADAAGRYYEDALQRFERRDDAGAVIQLKNALQADPSLLAAHLLMGRAALRNGDYSTADVALKEAQRRGVSRAEYVLPYAQLLLVTGRQKELLDNLQPDGLPPGVRYELLLLRAQAYLDANQLPAADSTARDALALNPAAAGALTMRARVALHSGRTDDAAQRAEEATTIDPADSGAWAMRADVAYASGLVAQSIPLYDRAIQLSPDNREALLGRSSALMDLGRMADAKLTLSALAKVAPKEPRSAYLRAVIAELEGDRGAASKLLNEVIGIIDPLPRAILLSRSHLPLIAGLAHLGVGSTVKARDYFELHGRFFPSQPASRKPLAAIQLAQGDAASALTTLEPLRRSGATDPEVLTLMASAYTRLKRHQQATDLLEEAAKENNSPRLQTALGLSMIGSRQTEAGLQQLRGALKKEPGQARASVVLAVNALREQKPMQAVELAEAVIKREPGNLSAINLLGVARAAAGDFSGARKAYEQALAADRGFDSAKLNLARLDVAEGKPDQARARLDELIKTRPTFSAAQYERALLDIAEKRLPEAISRLEALREKDRRHVESQLALIDAYVRTGAVDKALSLAKESRSGDPGYMVLQAALVQVQLLKGDSAGAKATLSVMTRAADFDATAQYRIALLQRQAGNNAGAAYSVEKALQGDPGFIPAKILQADLLLAEGAADRADSLAQAILKMPSPPADAHRLAGDIAFSTGAWPAASRHYRAALTSGAGADVAARLYQADLRSGTPAQARASIEALVKARPGDVPIKLLLSQVQTETGQLREAKATLEGVLKLGDSAPLLNNLALLQWQLSDPAALKTAERAFKLAPDEPVVLDTLGWILAQQGQSDAALRYLREARLRSPDNPEIRYHLGWTLLKAGRKSEAREEFRAALTGDRTFVGHEQARALAAQNWNPL
ncbi:MAG: PEP-CTERM system TPR-repeat protein PrsT [Burkholderiales bacterium]|nr:PEP-CTERM system TPR-repeat protein PrsT [Burkholderiales bacterium]